MELEPIATNMQQHEFLHKGAASEVEVLRLKRQATDLYNQIQDIRHQYEVNAREELAKTNTEIESQQAVIQGRSDSLQRTVLKAPVRGIVKQIDTVILGGVIPQNGKLMSIVPMDEKLLVDIRTGEKTILNYLLQPFNKAKEALRER